MAAARTGIVAAVGLAALALPAAALAHGLGPVYVSRLPLVVYLAGAAAAVALSFAFVLVFDTGAPADPAEGHRIAVPAAVRIGLRAVGLGAWLWVVAQAVLGGSGAGDVGSLFLWVYGWVGVALVSALVGPIWQWLDPFATLHDIGAALVGRRRTDPADDADRDDPGDPGELPPAVGRWPAVAGFAFFVWLELVGAPGAGGRTLGVVLVAYTALTLLLMAQYGRDTWRERGETFSVWFGLLGRLAPYRLGEDGRSVRRQPLGTGLLAASWTSADIALVALGAASILYDGLSQTVPWTEAFGSPAVGPETLLLIGFLGLVAGAALLVGRLVGRPAIGAGLVPIAVGYLLAHYLTYLLFDGQRILVAIADPFQRGWDLTGTAFHEPSIAWLPASALWTIQLVSVVGGHMLGAWAGHAAALAGDGGHAAGRDVRLRQVPLALVMVALTAVTLWSLGQAVVVEAG